MGWDKAYAGECCSDCGCDLDEGESMYETEDGDILCSDCKDGYDDAACADIDDDRYGDYDSHIDFADPGGRSALRAATPSNPRNLPCPTCGEENRLTPADRACGYQCDECADRAEGYGY